MKRVVLVGILSVCFVLADAAVSDAASSTNVLRVLKRVQFRQKEEPKAETKQEPAVEKKEAPKVEKQETRTPPRTETPRPRPAAAAEQEKKDSKFRRIDLKVENGSLMPADLDRLKTERKAVAALRDLFKGDGIVASDEGKQLLALLNELARTVFQSGQDAAGKPAPVYQGLNVVVKEDILRKLNSGAMTRGTARKIAEDIDRILEVRRVLATEELNDEKRAVLKDEYNELLNSYFDVPVPQTTDSKKPKAGQ